MKTADLEPKAMKTNQKWRQKFELQCACAKLFSTKAKPSIFYTTLFCALVNIATYKYTATRSFSSNRLP